jgi:hypothetical protein
LAAILQINQGHDDTRPDSFVVWPVLRLAHEFEEVFSQRDQIRLRQAHRCPCEMDLSSLPCFPGDTRCGNIGPCGLKHGSEKISNLKRGSLVAGWLNGRRSVHPLDLASGKAAVLGNLNQPGLFELSQVVVESVRRQASPFSQFFDRLGSPPQAFEQANPQGVRQRAMHRSQARMLMLCHILKYISTSEEKSSQQDKRVRSKEVEEEPTMSIKSHIGAQEMQRES